MDIPVWPAAILFGLALLAVAGVVIGIAVALQRRRERRYADHPPADSSDAIIIPECRVHRGGR